MDARAPLIAAMQAGGLELPLEDNKASAVLLPVANRPQGPTLVMLKKAAKLRLHAGQISFPGGGIEVQETAQQAALREAWEEIGLEPQRVEILGALDDDRTYVTNYHIRPLVAWIQDPPLTWRADPSEVERVLELPLAEVIAAEPVSFLEFAIFGHPFRAPRYEFADGTIVWGASARILAKFIERVRPHWQL